MARSGEEQLEVVVHFGAGAHGAARVAGHHLLFNGDGRADADDPIHIRLFQPPHELPRITAQAFHIAPLAFGIERIEGQTALSTSAQSGDHHQFAPWNIHTDVL